MDTVSTIKLRSLNGMGVISISALVGEIITAVRLTLTSHDTPWY
jgi:hypothetical protein